MLFLVKCLVVVLLVCFALDWRIGGPAARQPTPAQKETPVAAKARATLQQGAIAAARAGADAAAHMAADAVQSRCVASPDECLALARRLRQPESR